MTVLTAERQMQESNLVDGLANGTSAPLGATICSGGVNFSIYSKHATGIELLLFDHVDDAKASRTFRIARSTNRTYHYWHILVPGISSGQI